MDTLVKKAYDNWMHVVEYDGQSLLNYNQNKTLGTSQPQLPMVSYDYSNTLDQQISIPSLPVPVPAGQPTLDSEVTVGGIYFQVKRYYHTVAKYGSKRRQRLLQLSLIYIIFLNLSLCSFSHCSFCVLFIFFIWHPSQTRLGFSSEPREILSPLSFSPNFTYKISKLAVGVLDMILI